MVDKPEISPTSRRGFIVAFALLIIFSALTKGAHDIWAATAVYVSLLGLALAFVGFSHRFSKTGIRLPLVLPAGLLIAAFGLSHIGAVNPSESFLALMDWSAFLIIFFLAANVCQSDRDQRLLIALLVPLFWLEFNAVFGEWLYLRYLFTHSLRAYQEPVGTFIHANSTVAFCLPWIPFLVDRSFLSKQLNSKRWYWASGLVAIILILILISSTWSLFCLLVGAGLFFQHRFKSLARQHPRLFMAVCVTSATVMAVFFWNKLAQIYGWGGFRASRGGPTSRLDWWISGLKMWKDHPWFGVGIGNYPSAFPAYQTGTGLKTLYAHGFFVQVLSETGLIGFLALLVFLGRCWSRWRAGLNNSSQPIAIGLCLLLIYSTIQISFEYLSHLLIFGIFLGSIFSSGGPSLTWKPRLSVKIIFVSLGLFALPYLVSPFLASRLWVDGNYLLDENKWEEAEQRFQSSLALDKRSWEPYWGLARIAAARDDFSAAIRWGREALVRNKLDLRLKRTLDGFVLSQETNS